MHIDIEVLTTGWHEISVGIREDEIEIFIEMLKRLKNEKNQHFHISSTHDGDSGIGDIEFYVQKNGENDNSHLTGLSLAPNR